MGLNKRWLSKIQAIFGSQAIILMYHRIADLACDPWELAVSPDNFEQQLQVLQKMGTVISLPTLADQLQAGSLKGKNIVLTFDDGYEDNFLIAKPLLEKYRIPATFFIPTESISLKREFWWDELERIFIHTETLPPQLNLNLLGEQLKFDFHKEVDLTDELQKKHKSWKHNEPAPSIRSTVYMLLWQKLIGATSTEQQQVLRELRHWAKLTEEARPGHHGMSEVQLKQLGAQPLFEIGSHTVTHTALGHQPAEIQRREIKESKEYLENITGYKLQTFSFPNGSHNQSARNILKTEGFTAALTTDHLPVTKRTDRYQLSRFQVNNWPAPEFQKHLSRWMQGFS